MRITVLTTLLITILATLAVHAEEVEKPRGEPCDGENQPGYTCTTDSSGTQTTTGPDGTVVRRQNDKVVVTYPSGGTATFEHAPHPVSEEGKKSGCSMAFSPHPLGSSTPLTPLGLVLAAGGLLLRRRRLA
jgi:hypothetical protein